MQVTINWITGKNPATSGYYLVTTATGLVRIGRYYKHYNRWEINQPKAWAELPPGHKTE